MRQPFFSIIIPVYNKENYLAKCVESVLLQDFDDYELILVDDGSTDRSGEKCDSYTDREYVHVIHKENGGAAEARNTGLDNAAGLFILFMDADDYWNCSDLLSNIKELIEKKRCDEVIFGMVKQDNNREIPEMWIKSYSEEEFENSEDKIQYLMKHNMIQASAYTKVVKRSVIEDHGIRFVPGQYAEDIEWNLKIMLEVENVAVFPQTGYVYRQVSGSASHSIKKKHIVDMANMIKDYIAADTIPENKKTQMMHYLANYYLIWLTITNYVDNKEIRPELNSMRQYYYLLDYDWYPYVKRAKRLKWVGYGTMRRMLGIYRRIAR